MDLLTMSLEKVDFLPPNRVTDDTSILTLKNLVFEPLLKWENGLVRPALFERWVRSADGREWRFFIRQGATFHDGKPCTSQDIIAFIADILTAVDTFGMKWSYARYLAQATISPEAGNVVLVRNPTPIADILDIFSEFYICRTTNDGRPILGTGPYQVSEFEVGQRAVLDRVSRGTGPDRIVALAERRAEARYESLKAGWSDAALNLERIEGVLDFSEDFQWGKAVNTLSVMYYLNCQSGLFRSPEARLAANHAVDGSVIARDIFHGLAIASSTIVSPFHLGAREAGLKPIPYDVEKARRLIDKAEVSGPIQLRTPTFMPERAPEISTYVADCLEKIGLNVDVQIEEDRPEYARQIGRKEMGDMAIFDSSPHSTYRILNDKISSTTKAVWWQGFDDAETERLISAANCAVSDIEREVAYGRCLKRLHDNPPWLYLVHPIDVFAASKTAPGLSIDHKGTLNIS
ncbi:ABC transporter substrate-binding protein [Rhizobium oryzicola]|uniref:ABC transporter substrate-binding protein n=1 Tax=Rhizobium oryzicola TaxID=1232668 RepID=A0ABT8T7X4_9HYPH|nr:ABC transporter substrate-binding protein [Rhizobium oryzicola]MDO1585352.1 ABC transporter substrate-binding protein [Rhizobium oryzicola]